MNKRWFIPLALLAILSFLLINRWEITAIQTAKQPSGINSRFQVVVWETDNFTGEVRKNVFYHGSHIGTQFKVDKTGIVNSNTATKIWIGLVSICILWITIEACNDIRSKSKQEE